MFILSCRAQLARHPLVTNLVRMRITRSASRAAAAAVESLHISEDAAPPALEVGEKPKAKTTKRKASAPAVKTNGRKKARTITEDNVPIASVPKDASVANVARKPLPIPSTPPVLVPAKLTFSFETAKQHLIAADSRFEDIFNRMKCRPFEHLEQVDPFRTLTHSILGQQISWLAARSITHRFIRLFDPSLPEKPTGDHKPTEFFPSAHQVVTMDIPTLRTAGLSQRKAEYVLDLAARFADGRLSTEILLEADDEALYEILTAVRGIGRWTVDMFAIFSLRRPDILPVGDLGVQRGVLRWFLSRHLPSYGITIEPKKIPKPPTDEDEDEEPAASQKESAPEDTSVILPAPTAPVTPAPTRNGKGKGKGKKKVQEDSDDTEDEDGVLPTPFTPSINKILAKSSNGRPEPPLPEGLTVGTLKSRLDGKKKIKGAILTPQEMHDLTEPWIPYRSLGVYYMWALAEDSK